jgi:hypothetical protein
VTTPRDLEQLLPPPEDGPGGYLQAAWCTVESVDPVRVRLDGDSEAIPYTPTNLAGMLQVGQRVWSLRSGYTLVLVGVYGPDDVPPPPPSVPGVELSLDGLVHVWDGLDAEGNPQPPDWRYTELHLAPTADFTPTPATLRGVYTSTSGGRAAVYGLSPAVTYYARLVSVDATGNRSDPSGSTSGGVPQPLVADTSITDAIAAVQTTADGKARVVRSVVAPGAGDVAGYARGDQWWVYNIGQVTAFYLFSGTEWVAQQLTNAVLANLDAGKITTGTLNAARLVGIDIIGVTITGSTFRTSTNAATAGGMILNATGLHGYNSAGVEKTTVGNNGALAADGATFTNATISGTITSGGLTAISAEGYALIVAKVASGTSAGRLSPNLMEVVDSTGRTLTARANELFLINPNSSGGVNSLGLSLSGVGSATVSTGGTLNLTAGSRAYIDADVIDLNGYPKVWSGYIAAERTLTASNYTSYKTTTETISEHWPSTWATRWDGDLLIIPENGLYMVTQRLMFTNDSTSGNRMAMLVKNPSVNVLNSSTAPAIENRLAEYKAAASSDTTTVEINWTGRLAAGDKLMFVARTTAATNIANAYRTTNTLVKLGV